MAVGAAQLIRTATRTSGTDLQMISKIAGFRHGTGTRLRDGRRECHARRRSGRLAEGETWDAALRTRFVPCVLEGPHAIDNFTDGYLWEPSTRAFVPWKKFLTEDHQERIESFYSQFDVYPVHWLHHMMSFQVHRLAKYTDTELEGWRHSSATILDAQRTASSARRNVAFLCQAISSRYYPQTQTDRRTIRFPQPTPINPWNWEEFVRKWNAKTVATELQVDAEYLREQHRNVKLEATSTDPLADWYDLVSFIDLDERRRLRGSAQLAQSLYEMEHMLRLFHEDANGEELFPSGEDHTWQRDDLYGKGVTEDELQHLEFLVNRYHLNPRPKLILLVEGAGEDKEIPRLMQEGFGYRLAQLGIQVQPLGGITGFVGKKEERHGALERFIDEYHHRQTVVFLILDNEDQAAKRKKQLTEARSRYFRRRMIISPDHVRIWQRNIEFDNFTDEEIAAAMIERSHGKQFDARDVAVAREHFNKPAADHLSALYKEKTGEQLDKPALLRILIQGIINNIPQEFSRQPRRPILDVVEKIIELAAYNHQPFTRDTWERNQLSGYLGTVLPE